MQKKMKLLGSASVLAAAMLLSAPAMAGAPMGFAGVLSGNYSNTSCSGCGSQNGWGLGGQGAFGLGMSDLGGEVNANYNGFSGAGSPSVFGVGGSLFWAPVQGRVGGSFSWSEISSSGNPNLDTLTYGGFGEFYASDMFTIGGNAGGMHLSAGGGSANGYYIGGGATAYVMPNFGVTGAISYSHLGSGIGGMAAYSISGEYLISEETPVSLYAGYTNVDVPFGLPNMNVFTIGLKLYAGGSGSLRDRHRNGALDSLVAPSTLGLRSVF